MSYFKSDVSFIDESKRQVEHNDDVLQQAARQNLITQH